MSKDTSTIEDPTAPEPQPDFERARQFATDMIEEYEDGGYPQPEEIIKLARSMLRFCRDTEALCASQAAQLAALREATAILLAKYDECEPHITNAFTLAFTLRGMTYRGPNFAEELSALRAAQPERAG